MAGCSPGKGGDRGRRGRRRVWQLVFVCSTAARLASGDATRLEFVPRSYSGEGNNLGFPSWGSTRTAQIRAVAGAEFAADGSTAPGSDRPTAREVMTDVFLPSTAALSPNSALFVAWGQLVSFDLSLTRDNESEPFPVPCNFADDQQERTDIWCPLGDASDDIPFFRSEAAVDEDGVRDPINYASSYLDLDFVYGRTADEAMALRTGEGGAMNVTATGIPHQNSDGTWLIADQRTARYPVTFALHSVLLLEHNRCCRDVAPNSGFEGDEDVYQACRGWTIATFQHMTQNEFLIRLLGFSLEDLQLKSADDVEDYSGDIEEEEASAKRAAQRLRRKRLTVEYNENVNAAADVFAVTAGAAALESALPGMLRIVSEGFVSVDDDYMDVTEATADMAGLFDRNELANIVRGAALSPALDVDLHYASIFSNRSPLFKLPVDAVQRNRDHGLPTYNDAREAYGLGRVAGFSDLAVDDSSVASRLSDAYGGDIENVDAFTGSLAESAQARTGSVFGELLHEAWSDQLLRSITGDRLYHSNDRVMEDVSGTTLSTLLARVTGVTDLPSSAFQASTMTAAHSVEWTADENGVAEVLNTLDMTWEALTTTVCEDQCASDSSAFRAAVLSDGFEVSWEEVDDDVLAITLGSSSIGGHGWLGIGWGGLIMETAQDYVLCVLDETEFSCTDRAPTSQREPPPLDEAGATFLNITAMTLNTDWASITFLRNRGASDAQDYDLGEDIDDEEATEVVFAFGEGDISQHSNANRGAATVNFATGNVEVECEDNDFVLVHGSLMLVAWMVLAPLGIYFVRYRKGECITLCTFDFEWFEMHQELMIIASEAVLPLAITAVFASGGDHTTEHAHWGFYLIAAVALQVLSGFVRVKGLEAAQANFSLFHRFNKHFHIWSGRIAYAAGVVQCYRGLELVSGDDNLVLSAGDGLDLELSNYDTIKEVAFPLWFFAIAACFVYFETRKQYRRYFRKGAAKLCGFVEVVNTDYKPKSEEEGEDEGELRLVPRTEDLPLYTVSEFNDKVLHGQSWVLVDGAILDVSEFSHRHPGGARLILNALGTDITHELLGEDLSVGHAMSFSPHRHPESAWTIVRSLVIGYIEEDEEEEEEEEEETERKERGGSSVRPSTGVSQANNPTQHDKNRAFRVAGKAVMLAAATRRTSVMGEQNKAKRTNDLSVLPEPVGVPDAGTKPASSGQPQGGLNVVSPPPPGRLVKRLWSSKNVLERYHVCPLLFREKMGAASGVGRGNLPTKRPVYRYIFSCPGQAQALAEAITGVCHFNVRGQPPGKGIIQRSYNAYAVRVQDFEGEGRGGGKRGGLPKIIPASETTRGTLCVEMRIRIYHDGAMSQLLEKLAKDPDNPAVQLQGPYVVTKLVPPPAHRNVIMIAAGTGVNPMVQQIRDYLALPRVASSSSRSRLSLVWQAASEAELYGTDEITALQAKSQGLLEVTVLISGDQRRRNIPGAAFKNRIVSKARAMVSPMMSSVNSTSSRFNMPKKRSSNSSTVANAGSERLGNQGGDHGRRRKTQEEQRVGEEPFWAKEAQSSKFGPHQRHLPAQIMLRAKELAAPSRRPRSSGPEVIPSVRRDPSLTLSEAGGGLSRGKVTKEVLEVAFGRRLLNDIEEYNLARKPAGGPGEQKNEVDNASDVDVLAGSDSVPGKLQVAISGPSGFVFYVESILVEMGVPSSAIVLLD